MSYLINFCTKCGSNLRKQKSFSSEQNVHVCEVCGQELLNPNSESDLIWHCNKCGDILNNQSDWCDGDGLYQCTNCGAYNDLDDPDSEEYWEDGDDDNSKTFKQIFEDFTEEQKKVTYYLIDQAIEYFDNDELESADIEDIEDFEEYFGLSSDYEPADDPDDRTIAEVYDELTRNQKATLHYIILSIIQNKEMNYNNEYSDDDEEYDDYDEDDDAYEEDEEDSKEEQEEILLCPVCRTEISNWHNQVVAKHFIQCPQCGKRYYDPNVYNGEKFKGVYWHCTGCNSLLNIQKNFNDKNGVWFCSECGFKNIINESNIEENAYYQEDKRNKK